jgi:hypothetical protein
MSTTNLEMEGKISKYEAACKVETEAAQFLSSNQSQAGQIQFYRRLHSDCHT